MDEQEQQNVRVEPAPLSPPPSHTKLIIGIAAVFVLVVAGIAGAYFLLQQKTQSADGIQQSTFSSDSGSEFFLQLSDKKIPLIFENDLIDQELKTLIVDDISLVYSRFEKYEISKFGVPDDKGNIITDNPSIYYIKGEQIKTNTYIHFGSNKGYFIPDAHLDNFGDLVEYDGTQFIVVTNELIIAYKDALLFKSSRIDEFNKLEEFINYVNNNISKSDSITFDEITNLLYFDHIPESNRDTIYKSLKETNQNPFLRIRLIYPSILQVFVSDFPDESNGLLVAESIVSGKDYINRQPLVFNENIGDWQIVLFFGD